MSTNTSVITPSMVFQPIPKKLPSQPGYGVLVAKCEPNALRTDSGEPRLLAQMFFDRLPNETTFYGNTSISIIPLKCRVTLLDRTIDKTGVVEINPFDPSLEDGQCLVSSRFLGQKTTFTLSLGEDLPGALSEDVAGSLGSKGPNLQQVYGFVRNVFLAHYVYSDKN